MEQFLEALKSAPVIAAARDLAAVQRAASSDVAAIFFLGGTILNLSDMTRAARAGNKRVFVHLDLLGGLGRDQAAVEWCAREIRPDGVISTRTPLLKYASDLNLTTIQRLFVMDSASLLHGEKQFKGYAPDMIEVLPGLVPKAISHLSQTLHRPVIAGGMITEPDEVREALKAGAVAVSASNEALWRLEAGR